MAQTEVCERKIHFRIVEKLSSQYCARIFQAKFVLQKFAILFEGSKLI